MYLACPTNPLKGHELNTSNLTWVHLSILWQYFLSYANTKKIQKSKVSVVYGGMLLISINFDKETEQLKRR